MTTSRPFKKNMKVAYCGKCGKEFGCMVPTDATDIICFDCDNRPYLAKTLKTSKKHVDPTRKWGDDT